MEDEHSEERRMYLLGLIKSNDDFVVRAFEVSVRYAEMYLKNCFILNGGAILAFPTMAQLSNINVHDHKIGFIVGLASLSLGLITSLISVAAASAWFDKNMSVFDIDSRIIRRILREGGYKNDSEEKYWNNSQRVKTYRWRRFYALMTILFATTSGIAFIFGIITSGLVVSELDLIFLPTEG